MEILHKKLRRPLLRSGLVRSRTHRTSAHRIVQFARLRRHETHTSHNHSQQAGPRLEHVANRNRKIHAPKRDQKSLSRLRHVGHHRRRSRQSILSHDRNDQGKARSHLIHSFIHNDNYFIHLSTKVT